MRELLSLSRWFVFSKQTKDRLDRKQVNKQIYSWWYHLRNMRPMFREVVCTFLAHTLHCLFIENKEIGDSVKFSFVRFQLLHVHIYRIFQFLLNKLSKSNVDMDDSKLYQKVIIKIENMKGTIFALPISTDFMLLNFYVLVIIKENILNRY